MWKTSLERIRLAILAKRLKFFPSKHTSLSTEHVCQHRDCTHGAQRYWVCLCGIRRYTCKTHEEFKTEMAIQCLLGATCVRCSKSMINCEGRPIRTLTPSGASMVSICSPCLLHQLYIDNVIGTTGFRQVPATADEVCLLCKVTLTPETEGERWNNFTPVESDTPGTARHTLAVCRSCIRKTVNMAPYTVKLADLIIGLRTLSLVDESVSERQVSHFF